MKEPIKFLVVLPTIVEEIADKCIASLDDNIKNNMLIVDNSPNGFAQKYNIRYLHHPENLGVSRSWNIAAKEVVDKKLDYLILLSASIIFENGMSDFIESLNTELQPNDKQQYCVETQVGWHLVAIGRATLEQIGYFDENFYPAYYEDTDYIRRMEMAGFCDPMNASNHCPVVQVSAHRQGVALSIQHGLRVNFKPLGDYFIQKWGNAGSWESIEERNRMYRRPFNDETKPLSYWESSSVDELKERYEL